MVVEHQVDDDGCGALLPLCDTLSGMARNYRTNYPWLRLRPGAHWPRGRHGRDLLRRLNRVGRDCRRLVLVTSGHRSPYRQWVAYMDYLRGGELAAPCCGKHWLHTWSQCGRSCQSNHCRDRAVDCLIEGSGADDWHNIGEDAHAREALRRNGLCLPVGSGETWHVEVGDVWRS